MSWFKSLMGRSDSRSDEELSPEVAAIFEKIYRYLNDENAQNDRLPEPLRSTVKGAAGCDVIPGASGDFGRALTNPIPVNGPLGEVIYLSNLLSASGNILLFHRLRSIKNLDVYETVTSDAKVWDILILDFYHPRKTKLAPGGYRIASGSKSSGLFSGSNTFVQNFPIELPNAIRVINEQFLGVDWGTPHVRLAVERTTFVRPPDHAARVNAILTQVEPDIVGALTKQTIGGQSVMYRLFREALGCEDSSIRRLELTYFAASVVSYVYLRFGKERNRDQILDRFAQILLESSIPSSGEQMMFGAAVSEYQRRYAEYNGLLSLLFSPDESTSGTPAITLMLHVYECVTRSNARAHMIEIAAASSVISQFVLDHVEFVKKM